MGWDIKFNDRWQRGDRLSARWANAMARALNRAECLSDSGRLFLHADGGLKLELDAEAGHHHYEPLRITLPDSGHYSVTAGRVWLRGIAAASIAAVADQAIPGTRWLYVPLTLSTSGVLTAGVITESETEPTYWTRDGSNQTVINYTFGKIGSAGIEWNTTGDIYLFDQAGQTVAVSAANNPGYLAAAFKDTGTRDATTDILVRRDELQDSAPGQKIRLYVARTDRPGGDWDEKVAVDSTNNPNYLAALFYDAAAMGAGDVVVYRDALQGSAPNQKIRLHCQKGDITHIIDSTYIRNVINNTYITDILDDLPDITDPVEVIGRNSGGTIGWVELEAFECPTT